MSHFAVFEQSKVDIHFADFGQVKIDPTCSFFSFGQVTVVLLNLDNTLGRGKQSKPTPFDKKIKNHP